MLWQQNLLQAVTAATHGSAALVEMVGQPHGDVRNQAQNKDTQHHQADKGHGSPDDGFQFDIRRDAVDHEQVESDGRMDQTHFHEYGHDHAKPYQIDPHGLE